MKLILIDCAPFPNEDECRHLDQNDQHRVHKVTASYLAGWWPFRRRVDVTGQLYLHYGTKYPDVKKEATFYRFPHGVFIVGSAAERIPEKHVEWLGLRIFDFFQMMQTHTFFWQKE